MALYLSELRYLVTHYINLCKDFFGEIKSNHIYFNHKKSKYQPNITEIIVYYKIIKKKLHNKDEVYNNKMCII